METQKLKNVGWVSIMTAALLALTLLIVSGGEGQITQALADSAQLTRQLTVTVYLPLVARDYDPAYVSPFGIVMYDNVDDAAGRQKMQEAGSKWVTTVLPWSVIEPTKGNYDWSSFDAKAQNAKAAGMDVFVLFFSNPAWAAALPGGPLTDTRDLVDFMTLAAERYDCDGTDDALGSPCVHYWSFYAEPDNGDLGQAYEGKGYWGHNGAGFAAMLFQVSPAIHAANPQAKVLIGGLAYDWFEEESGPFVRSFLTDTLTTLNGYPGGAPAYIDAVAFHFYPISGARWPTIREKALEVRGIMERHGAGDLPLLCPETGFWSSSKFGSSEQKQAQWLAQMYVRGVSVGIPFLSWYQVFDIAEAGGVDDLYPDRTSGLLRKDGALKPSYYAYRTMTQELAWARYLRSLQQADAEGYVFRMPNGREKTVAWATITQANVIFPYTRLRWVDTLGNAQAPINDGGPGDWDYAVNGQIALRVELDTPIYVEPY